MPTQSQIDFKSVMAKADAIYQKATAVGSWSKEDGDEYQKLLNRADELKLLSLAETHADELKAWAQQGQGSAVATSLGFSRPAGPTEGAANLTGSQNQDDADADTDVGKRLRDFMATKKYTRAYEDYIKGQCKAMAFGGRAENLISSTSLKVLQEGIEISGGAWVVPEYNPFLIGKAPAPTGIASNVRVWPCGSDRLVFPKAVYSGASDDTAGSIFTSGMRIARGQEAPNSDFSEATNPIAGKEEIQVFTYVLPVIITRSLVEDNQFPVLEWVSGKIAESLTLGKDYLYVSGAGVNTVEGILSHPNASVATASGGMYVASGVSAALTWAGIASGSSGTPDTTKGLEGLWAALPPQYDAQAKFYAAKGTWAAARGLVDTTMRQMWNPVDAYPSKKNGMPAELLGGEVVNDQWVPAIAADSYSVIYGDLGGYYAVERVSMSLEVLKELRALKDEYVLYCRARFGGKLVEDWRVKTLKLAAS